VGNDLRFALRTLARSPAFTAIAALSIALGIGANTAIFSLLDQVLLRQLPVIDPSSIVLVRIPEYLPGAAMSDSSASVFSYPMYKDLRDRGVDAFSDLIARASFSVSFQHTGATERARAEVVSGNFFEALGVKPLLGRTLSPDDDRTPEAHPVIVLSHSFWTRQFGASPSVLNQTVRVNGNPMTIVGVTSPRFVGMVTSQLPDFFVPVMMKKQITPTWDKLFERDTAWLTLFARLKPGMPIQRAEAAITPVFRSVVDEYLRSINLPGGRNRDRLLSLNVQLLPAATGLSNMRERWRTPLVALAAMVGLVLLIACVNVANLMITRAAARSKEIAIRASLGAGRAAIMRQLLIEATVLSLAGGALGMIIAYWAVEALLRLMPFGTGPSVLAFYVDERLLAFTFLLVLITAIMFGLAPAWQASRADLASVLKAQAGAIASGSAHARMRRAMVAAQVALALVLLTGAGLFARSLYNLLALEPGFQAENLLTFSIDPRLSGYDHNRALQFYRELQTRLSAIHGVTGVAAAFPGPFSNSGRSGNVTVEGYRAAEGEDTNASHRSISAGYFSAMRIPLVSGREFTERDIQGAPKVAIVNEQFVRHFLKKENPLGRHLAFGAGDVKLDIEIVGVVRGYKHSGLRDEVTRALFLPYLQESNIAGMNIYVRAARDENALSGQARTAVASIDPSIPMYNVSSMRVEIEKSIYTERLLAAVSMTFGLLATILASVGVYGVIAYNVARRTSEIGLRVALGAERGHVLRMVLGEVLFLAMFGVIAGIAVAFAAGRMIETQLFGIKAADPMVFSAAALAIAVAAALAAWIPARRAAGIDPIQALRYE
jgi:predicted permease